MGSLNQDASAVVRAGRSALRATSADRERVEAALNARLGPHAFPPSTPVASSARMLALRAIAATAIGACVVGAVFLASKPGPGGPPAGAPVAGQLVRGPALPGATNPAPVAAVEQPATPTAADAAERTSQPPSSAPRRPDALTQEVALLSRAVAALNAGRAGEALTTLNEHQRQFPHGILGAERQAAQAQALCSLGRVSQGRAELAHLSPRSPAAGRAKQVCDSVSTDGHSNQP